METEYIINSKDFIKLINNFGDIYLNYNNHVEKISHKSSSSSFKNNANKNIIKLITYKELLMEISSFENKTLNYFIERGLDKNINKKGSIALIVTKNKNKSRLESYDFSLKEEEKEENKGRNYDIPYYHNDVPEGFSMFCTDEEFNLVITHVNRSDYQKVQKKEEEKKEELITSEPQPSKKNFICQLCKSRFDNYKEHIVSETHIKNINKHKNSYNKLSLTFKRIINNNFNNISKGNSHNDSEIKVYDTNNNFDKIYEDFDENNNTKNIRNENDFGTSQQQMSSTASSAFKNSLSLFEETSEFNKNYQLKKNHKRKREEDELFYYQNYLKNKRIKI